MIIINKEQGIIFVICYSIACIFIYKYYLYYRKKKNMKFVKGICTDTVYRTGYSKNTYSYFYSYRINKEEFNTSDKIKFRLPFFNPKIKDKVMLLVDMNNPKNHITPWEIFLAKIYLFSSICLVLLPFLFVI